jgi:hypothetical protein
MPEARSKESRTSTSENKRKQMPLFRESAVLRSYAIPVKSTRKSSLFLRL